MRRLWQMITAPWQQFGLRLMALYLLFLVVPLLGIGLYGDAYTRQSVSRYLIQSRLDEVRNHAALIDNRLGALHADLLYMSQRLTPTNDTAHAELVSMAVAHPLYQQIVWVDEVGQRLAGRPSADLTNWLTTPAFRQAAAQPPNAIHITTYGMSSVQPTLLVTMRLEAGLLLVEMDSGWLLRAEPTDQADHHWMLRLDDTVITNAAAPPALDQLTLTGHSGYFDTATDLVAYHRTGPGGSWTLLCSTPLSELHAGTGEYYTTVTILLIGGLVSVAGLAIFTIARVTEPLHQLERMVAVIRRGKRPHLPSPLPTDEFGKLMIAFDQMAAELDERRKTERALVEQLIQAREDERKFIAYDLHDGLLQQLIGAKFFIGQCRKKYTHQLDSESDSLTHGYNILTESITEGRRIIQGLHPTVLDDVGLEAALVELTNSTAASAGWTTQLDICAVEPQPDHITRVTCYRIAQEALSNVFKHAGATHVQVRLACNTQSLTMSIIDDGCGFDVALVTPSADRGWGLQTMYERAAIVGGTVQIDSQPGKGTVLSTCLPRDGTVHLPEDDSGGDS